MNTKTPEQLNANTIFAFQMAVKGHDRFQFLLGDSWQFCSSVSNTYPHRIYHDIPEGWTLHDGEEWKGDKDAKFEAVMFCDGRVIKNENSVKYWSDHYANIFTREDPKYRIYAYKLAKPAWKLGNEVNGHKLPDGDKWTTPVGKEWTAEMLPEGTRPIMESELRKLPNDAEYFKPNDKEWVASLYQDCRATEYHTRNTFYRTRTPIPKPALSIPEGFTKWDGGECPVAPKAIIEYIMRKVTRVIGPDIARDLKWKHRGLEFDIIAYRVIPKKVVPWTIEEINLRVGQVVKSTNPTNPCRCVITQTNGVMVWIGGDMIARTPEYLMTYFLQLNGEVCGTEEV